MRFFLRPLIYALLLISACSDNPSQIAGSTVAPAMEYVDVCKAPGDCKKFSRLVMGTDHLVQGDWTREGAPEPTEEEAFRVLDEAARQGINFFDTSPIYVGDVEHRLGKWKKSRTSQLTRNEFYVEPGLNPDRKWYTLSKGGFPFDLFWAKKLERGTHAPELKRALEASRILDPKEVLRRDGSLSLKDVPPGTYASRLYGPKEQIAERISEELGHTVKNLNGDIAVYLMHRDDGDALRFRAIAREKSQVSTILGAIAQPEISGKFWALGWSNWETDRIDESLRASAARTELPKPLINSPYFSLFEMSERSIHALGVQVTHREMMNPNFQKGIKLMPYSPLGGFSILDKPEPKWENAKKAAKKKYDDGDAYWQNVYPALFTAANEARWNRVVQFTKDFNFKYGTAYTVDQMINAYALAHPRTDLLAIGAITVEQVQRTVKSLALAKRLTSGDLEFLYSGERR